MHPTSAAGLLASLILLLFSQRAIDALLHLPRGITSSTGSAYLHPLQFSDLRKPARLDLNSYYILQGDSTCLVENRAGQHIS
jgi:hypothetical protein